MDILKLIIDIVKKMFSHQEKIPQVAEIVKEEKEPEPIVEEKIPEVIFLEDLITSSNRFPERAHSKELTPEVLANLSVLKDRVNLFLYKKNIKNASVTSGFRPSAVNANIANAATRSSHMTGEACDLLDDKQQSMARSTDVAFLEEVDLYMEDPNFTIGKNTNWCHVQTRRTGSGRRIFKP